MVFAYSVIILRLGKYEQRLGDRGNPNKLQYRRQVIKMLFVYMLNMVSNGAPRLLMH